MKHRTKWEIERKFVATVLPHGLLEPRIPQPIRQGYLCQNDDVEIRLRDLNGVYSMTVKRGKGLRRYDTTVKLKSSQFELLWAQTDGMRMDKKRYQIPYFGHRLDLDVFDGAL
jgi:CYTH domain-containing protein